MPEIEWNDSLHVGIPKIDAQHQKLTGMINELYYAYMNGEDKKVLSGIITGLSDYTTYHFGTEEQIMASAGYENMAEHVGQHHEFVSRTIDFLLAYLEDKEELTVEVLDYLTDWWLVHINNVDRKMCRTLIDQGRIDPALTEEK